MDAKEFMDRIGAKSYKTDWDVNYKPKKDEYYLIVEISFEGERDDYGEVELEVELCGETIIKKLQGKASYPFPQAFPFNRKNIEEALVSSRVRITPRAGTRAKIVRCYISYGDCYSVLIRSNP